MRLKYLSLTNFRNYGRLEWELPAGATLLYGDNAQGKTNLLEAVYYLATTRSPHTNQDQQLINWDAAAVDDPVIVTRLVGEVETAHTPQIAELRLIKEQRSPYQSPSFRREALVNRRKVRLMDLLGTVRVALFIPEDIQIITGSPANRRRYVDIAICQINRAYCRNLSAYNKALEQRNALLRGIVETGKGRELLPVFTDNLVELGGKILATRAQQISALGRATSRIHYEWLTDRRESLRLTYVPRLSNLDGVSANGEVGEDWLAETIDAAGFAGIFRRSLEETESAELPATTNFGPHRDDWQMWLNGRQLSAFGSRGQQRSAMLALKLAEIEWMEEQTGDKPILLLDEVVAELDEKRRALLLDTIQQSHQAIVTATDPKMFTDSFLRQATMYQVGQGRIQQNETVAVSGGK